MDFFLLLLLLPCFGGRPRDHMYTPEEWKVSHFSSGRSGVASAAEPTQASGPHQSRRSRLAYGGPSISSTTIHHLQQTNIRPKKEKEGTHSRRAQAVGEMISTTVWEKRSPSGRTCSVIGFFSFFFFETPAAGRIMHRAAGQVVVPGCFYFQYTYYVLKSRDLRCQSWVCMIGDKKEAEYRMT